MFHAATFAGQRRLAADYRETDVRRATRKRTGTEAIDSSGSTLEATKATQTPGAITRLLTFRPHAR